MASGAAKFRRPFVASFETDNFHTDACVLQTAFVGNQLFLRIPLVTATATDDDGRNPCQQIPVEFRRKIPSAGEDAANIAPGMDSGSISHRNALRKAADDQLWSSRPLRSNTVDDAGYVVAIIRNRKVAVLAGHPAGDDVATTTAIKTVKPLHGSAQPPLCSGHGTQALKLMFGAFGIAMETHEKWGLWPGIGIQDVPTVNRRGNVAFNHCS